MTPAAPEHPVPSDRARALVRGAYDTHIHVAPDVVKRRITDVALARRFAELGLAGFGLKSHYTSTAERARVVSEAVPEVARSGRSPSTARSAASTRSRSRSPRARARGSCGSRR